MCVIMARSKKNIDSYQLNEERLLNAIEQNNDGLGIMYKKDNRIKVFKTLENDPEKILGIVKQHLAEADRLEVDFLAHFRFCTHGSISEDNIHPFRIDTTRKGGPVFMMHNGVIPSRDKWEVVEERDNRSDTYYYASLVLGGMLKNNPRLVRNHQFRNMIARDIGMSNRITFMDKSGEMYIVAADGGHSEGGLWFSNDNYFESFSRYAGYAGYNQPVTQNKPTGQQGTAAVSKNNNNNVPTVKTGNQQKGGVVGKNGQKATTSSVNAGNASKPTSQSTSNSGTTLPPKSQVNSTNLSAFDDEAPKGIDFDTWDKVERSADFIDMKLLDNPYEAVKLYEELGEKVQGHLMDYMPDLVEDLEMYCDQKGIKLYSKTA